MRGPKNIKVHTRNRAPEGQKPSWQFYFKYYDKDGKRRTCSESGFRTEDEASRAGDAALALHKKKLLVENPDVFKMSLKEFIEKEWLPYMATNWNEATKINRQKLLKHITDEFGNKRLSQITQRSLKDFLDNLYLHTPMATSSVINIRGILSQIFLFAVEQGYLNISPLASYHPPNPNEFAVTCTKRGQIRDVVPDDILAQIYERFPAGTSAYLLLKICEHTGMRLSEAAALAYEDVDFEDRKIYVTRQIKVLGYNEKRKAHEQALIEEYPDLAKFKYVARNPKYNSKRVVAMSEELHDILLTAKLTSERNERILGKDYKRYFYTREYDPRFAERTFERFNQKRGKGGFQAADTFENGIINTLGIGYPLHFVNVKEDGTLLRPDYATDICASIHGANGKPVIYADFNFHSLRNTFASRRRAEGIPEHIISAMLGHKNETTTEMYMKIDYSEFDAATSAYRGKAPAPNPIQIEDHDSLEAYLKTLDKAALQNVMLSICAHISAAN